MRPRWYHWTMIALVVVDVASVYELGHVYADGVRAMCGYVSPAPPLRHDVSAWCAWSDWSVHSRNKCSPSRSACERTAKKKKLGDCTYWFL